MNRSLPPKLSIALLALVFAWAGVPLQGQIVLFQNQPPTTLVQNVLMGPGVFASNVTFNGNPGTVVPPTGVGPSEMGRFNGANCNIGFNSGIFLCTSVAAYHIPGPNAVLQAAGGGIGGPQGIGTPDIDLSHLTAWPMWQASGGSNIYNKSILEFDFVPIKDMVSVRYVFSSEEYERWVCTQYNDVFGFFLSGPGINGPYTNNAINLALVPGSLSRVSINTVNSGLMDASNANGPWTDPFVYCDQADPNWQGNAQYYRYNGGQWPYPQPPGGVAQLEAPYNADPYYIQHNGMTVVLTASAAVQCGQTYHIKLGLGNVGDNWFPSAVFLEQGSFSSSDRFSMDVAAGPNVEFTATDTILVESDCDSVYLRFHRWGGFYLDEYLQVGTGGTATAGVDYLPALPDSIHFNQLDSMVVVPIAVPVDADGLEELVVNLITCDGLKVQTYTFLIDQRAPLEVDLADVDLACPGTVTLAPTVIGGGGDPGAYSYQWNTGATSASITVDVAETEQFWVTVDDCWSLPVTDSAWVTLPPYEPMVLTLTPDTAIPCLGNADLNVQATLGSGGYSYAWTLGGALQGTVPTLNVLAPLSPVYYVVEVTDQCGVVASDSVLVSQAPPVPLTITLTPDTAVPCLGTAELVVVVSGGGGTIGHTWTNGAGAVVGNGPTLMVPASVLEEYTVEVTDQCGQTVSGSVVVTTGGTPPLVLEAEGDTVLCANTPMVLQVLSVSGGGGAYSYGWSPPGTGTTDGPALEVSVPDDSYFTVTVTDQCGNSADTVLLAMVEDHAPLVLTTSNDTIVCPGEQVSLWAQVSGGAGGYVVNWPGIGTGGTVQWTAGHGSAVATVNVTDVCGTTISGLVRLDVYPAQVDVSATDLGEGLWSFQARTDPTTGNELLWDLGDGTTAGNVMQVTHQYTDVEAHWVYVYMETEEGCTAVDSVRTTPPTATIYFPNAFSPNNDGINDTFGGEGALLDRYELYVFDRWGGIIFESQDPAVRWDGRMDGEEVMNGVYPYKYVVKGLKMPLRVGFGHVVLVR